MIRGFIELTTNKNRKMLFNVNLIDTVFIGVSGMTRVSTVTNHDTLYTVNETYDEVKQKMAEAINASSVVRVIE